MNSALSNLKNIYLSSLRYDTGTSLNKHSF